MKAESFGTLRVPAIAFAAILFVYLSVTSFAQDASPVSFEDRAVSHSAKSGSVWYLAEGTTAWGFDCRVCIENPNTFEVNARVTYMTDDIGAIEGPTLYLPILSQTTVFPAETLGQRDFSTRVECLEGETIAVDRTMFWTGSGREAPECHSSIGVTSPSTDWYLPEGTNNYGFETYELIQNPNAASAEVQVMFMWHAGPLVPLRLSIPPNSRYTIPTVLYTGEKDFSTRIKSDRPVIVERSMYRDNRWEGHESIGTTAPSLEYFLAEGTTGYGFTTYVLIQNPNAAEVQVDVTYMTTNGPWEMEPFLMPANSRATIRVNDVLLNTDFSTRVRGSAPIIAERAMYWTSCYGEVCHDSIGVSSPHSTFYFPDGDASGGWETWTLVQNPNDYAVAVTVSYLEPDGCGNVTFVDDIPANSRKTYNLADEGLISGRAAIVVDSSASGSKVMAERSMYLVIKGTRVCGSNTIGGSCPASIAFPHWRHVKFPTR